VRIVDTLLPGCVLLEAPRFEDARGSFVKTFHRDVFAELGIRLDVAEEYYSVSHRGVIRGMHFQVPPHDHDKLVLCTRGEVLDVVVDLRRGAGHGRVASTTLSADNRRVLFVPRGVAHGFVARTDEATMLYKTSTVHAPESDRGVRWDSFGFDWGVDAPVLSDRDRRHPALAEFDSPFGAATP